MSSNQITLKHGKHRVHPCPNDKKLSLLNLLITQNNSLKTIVVSSNNIEAIKEAITAENVTVLSDSELIELPELTCELLISYDLPSDADIYMSRLAKTTDSATILLDINEQKELYPIETLLKRVIKQEIIKGFEYEEKQTIVIAQQKPKREYAFKTDAKEKSERKPFEKPKYDKPKRDGEKSERKPFEKPKYDKPKRDGEKSERKPFDKPKYDKPKRDGEKSERKPFDKPKYDKPKRDGENSKKPNKFLGKDENGKAIFASKSGERNHRYDGKPKDTYEAPKKVGRKISIKERKPKETPES
ncbi:MAG: hypothetical protein A2513_00875 [Sulfurimonas sp. RIFOXYD12_FULL_33_39]|uniref:hypothetical protein n=1 Tax=unclassified Sulfurimonas TaxID=2623549 RepID=UPI0008B53A77|nr:MULTISPECIES: hypothetical protein [unclassified Sulfurimonas]OHE10874.1 MAG: hypothetical protein A2513_00875 [Sulfurimonas sp. RIFOXYD12_FULL_33_39]OHE13356.1 MAG: hypothetical protein A2530_07305 [Sulfurimonas sp. RIFOXYD2_FULL_34_21]